MATIVTNIGKTEIAKAISTSQKLTLNRVGFGDKALNPNKVFTENDSSLVNEKFRISLDNVYYPEVNSTNNALIKINAMLTPEQADSMNPVLIKEFAIYDSNGKVIIIGDTVPTPTKDDNGANGIDFEIFVTLPTADKVVEIRLGEASNNFNEAYKIKLDNIADEATKNKDDAYLLDRINHTGKQAIDTIQGLREALDDLENNIGNMVDSNQGVYLNHEDFINNNIIFPDEIPPGSNITDSKEKDWYYNEETSSNWYFHNHNWINSGIATKNKFNSVDEMLTSLEDHIEYLEELRKRGEYIGGYNTVADLPNQLPAIDITTGEQLVDVNGNPVFLPITKNSLALVKYELTMYSYDNGWNAIDNNITVKLFDLKEEIKVLLDGKVDNVVGKQLSTNDFTNELLFKLVNLNVIDSLVPLDFEDDDTLTPEELQELRESNALSQHQGTIINDKITNINTQLETQLTYIENIKNILATNDTTLDELQEIVNFIKLNRELLENLTINSIVGLEEALNKKANKTDLDALSNTVTNLNTTVNTKAPLMSPEFTGTPTAPNQEYNISNSTIATTKHVSDKIDFFINSILQDKVTDNITAYLPSGQKGEVPFVNTTGTSLLTMDSIVKVGYFAETSEELDLYKNYIGSSKEVFETWYKFSHASAVGSPQPYNTNDISSWIYNENIDTVIQTVNSVTTTGFVSNDKVDVYNHEVVISSTNNDNDANGLVIAFMVDADGREHTLTLVRQCSLETHCPLGNQGQYGIVYDSGSTQVPSNYVMVNGHSVTPPLNVGWSKLLARGVRLRVERRGDIIKTWTSSLTSTSDELLPESLLTLDLNSNPLLHKFKGKTSYGFFSMSQSNSYFKIIESPATIGNSIIDLPTGTVHYKDENIWKTSNNLEDIVQPGRMLLNQHNNNLYWFQGYDNFNKPIIYKTLPENIAGNAGTATRLKNDYKINGKVFNGTQDITVTDDTKQEKLDYATNIKTINGLQILGGPGDVKITEKPLVGVRECRINLDLSSGDPLYGTIDLALGNVFTKNVTEDIAFVLKNIMTSPTNNVVNSFILELTNAGNAIIYWFDNIRWENGQAPVLTPNGVDILGFYSYNNGNTWNGLVMAKDMK